MNLQQNDRFSGFIVTRVRPCEELNGTLVEMTHEKTGAQLLWMDNAESNKLFEIVFKTIPEDDSGVFHIIEHSVLCGSEKYPVKEPFVELLKSSMKTYLNAATASDNTRYPVSSRNTQDYLNLMRVYLDAVFAPRILTEPNIFYQEGWHIEENDGVPSYKGVVFNEMKGAMSQVNTLISRRLLRLLFPDNCYGCNSGGEPDAITELSYERFVESYRRFYHPSNAYVYLDGAVPLQETLAELDSYFSRYEKMTDLPVLPLQQPLAAEDTICYEIGQGEDCRNKARLALGGIICDWRSPWKSAAVYVLKDVLTGSNEAPLKKAILASGLAGNMSMGLSDSNAQHYWRMIFEDVKDGREEELRTLLRNALHSLAEDGIDREDLHASINRLEFMLREPEEPAGLIRCSAALSGWLYGGDPLRHMCCGEDMKLLREMADRGDFDALLREVLLNENKLAVLHVLPSATLGEEQRRREAERLQARVAAWTQREQDENQRLNQRLSAWQKTADTADQLAKLPTLSLSDVGEEAELTLTVERELCGVKLLLHPVQTHGILYFTAYFSLTDFSLEELTRLTLMAGLLGKLPTKSHSAFELQRLLKRYVGRMDFDLYSRERLGDRAHCTPCLRICCSVLEPNLPHALSLLAEILLETDFSAKEQIQRVVQQAEISCRQLGVAAGHALGVVSTLSHYSADGAVGEAISGLSRVKWIQKLAANFDQEIGDCIDLYQRVQKESFCRRRLLLSLTASQEAPLEALVQALPEGADAADSAAYTAELPRRLFCRIPARSSYSAQAWHMGEAGMAFDASFFVGAQILSLDYLWNAVRVQGGAYGASLSISSNGEVYSFSYRDPTPSASIEINRKAADYIGEFCSKGETLEKYIISTVAKTEPLLSPDERGAVADRNYFLGLGREDLLRMRREILSTDANSLCAFARVLREFADKGAVCLVAHGDALPENGAYKVIDL